MKTIVKLLHVLNKVSYWCYKEQANNYPTINLIKDMYELISYFM